MQTILPTIPRGPERVRPLAELETVLAKAAFAARNPLRARKVSLLFVDDQHFVRQLVSTLLNDRHLHVRFAETAAEAVEAYAKEAPHMVFLDIGMPHINGLQLLELITKYDRFAHPVMLTGSMGAEEVRLAKVHGAKGYIAKPFNRQTLVDCVERFVGAWRI